MQKLELDTETLTDFLIDTWHLYASQMYENKLLRLWTNSASTYKVVHGETDLYLGTDMQTAVDIWNKA